MADTRVLEPELLDSLPQEDPDALRSRRDMRRVNAWMLQAGIMRRLLAGLAGGVTPRTIVDLGAGDGAFLLDLARRLAPGWDGARAVLVDRQDLVTDATRAGFEAAGWCVEAVAADVFAYLAGARPNSADLVIANLFLHHFGPDDLARLLRQVARVTPRFAACEPRRGLLAQAGSRALWVLGCGRVTRHDAVVSVRAGFRGREISGLWPADGGWDLDEHPAGLFTHCFAACHGG